jgi:hypothetical protein
MNCFSLIKCWKQRAGYYLWKRESRELLLLLARVET